MPGSLLPKIVKCQYCDETVYEGGDTHKQRLPQALAQRELTNHFKTCEKATEEIKARLKKPSETGDLKANISDTNCPLCGKICRSDKIIKHMLSNHSFEALVCSMPLMYRKQSLTSGIPIVNCYKDGQMIVRFCLHCKKGCLATARTKLSVEVGPTYIKSKEKHTECCAAFEDYKYLFEMEEMQQDLPFHLYNCNTETPVRKLYGSDLDEIKEKKEEIKERKRQAKKNGVAYEEDETEAEKPAPVNTVIFEDKIRMLELSIKGEIIARKTAEADLKKLKDLAVAPADPSLLEIVPLLREIADDKYEEMDYEDLKDELIKFMRRNVDIEASLRKEHQKELAKKDMIIARQKAEIEEKDDFLKTIGTVSFGKGGKMLKKEDSDSD